MGTSNIVHDIYALQVGMAMVSQMLEAWVSAAPPYALFD